MMRVLWRLLVLVLALYLPQVVLAEDDLKSIEPDFDALDKEFVSDEDDFPAGTEEAPKSTLGEPITGTELGAEKDFIDLAEYNAQMRKYCRLKKEDPRCYEVLQEHFSPNQRLKDTCDKNPLDARCGKAFDKRIDSLLELQRLCAKNPKGKGCKRARKLEGRRSKHGYE
jgi:hypothetical protein